MDFSQNNQYYKNTESIDKNTHDTSNNVFSDSIINDERYIFGNLFGYIPKKYIKYFNLVSMHLIFVAFFAFIYYKLLLNFNKHFFIPSGFPSSHFLNHKFLIALYMSINFQTTTAYVDLKCKSFLSRTVIVLQLIETFMITFLFLTV